MNVRELMRPDPITVEALDCLDIADGIMRYKRIRHLPVVRGDRRLVGILSERDLLRAAVSSLLQFRAAAQQEWLATIPVKEVMTADFIAVPPSCSLRTAVDIMTERKIGCLPVVEDGVLVGLLSESDCLLHLAHLLAIAEQKDGLPELPTAG
jgi:CBS domain-containing membrane protein